MENLGDLRGVASESVFINSMFIILWSLRLNMGLGVERAILEEFKIKRSGSQLSKTYLLAVPGVACLSLAALLTCLAEAGVLGKVPRGLGLISMSLLRLCFLTTLTAMFS